jgi:hypothetical protein
VSEDSDGEGGFGLALLGVADVTLARARVERSGGAGLVVGFGAVVRGTDVILRDVDGHADGDVGRGIEIGDGATLVLTRAHVRRARDIGVFAHGPSTALTLDDLVVEDVAPTGSGYFGRGVHAQGGASIASTRALFRDCHEATITCASDAVLTLRDLEIASTRARGCAETTCAGDGAGIGLSAQAGGHIDVERFTVADSALCGAQVAPDGEVDLRRGTIARNPIGVNVQRAGYDLSRLTEGVVFRDNGANLDATALPVPDTASPLMP